jgi:hypothetical protein
MRYISADDWELITDALLRTADACEAAGQRYRHGADDARRHNLAQVARERGALAVQAFKQRDALTKLARKIAIGTPDELGGPLPGGPT